MPALNIAVAVSGLGGSITRSTPRAANAGSAREVPIPAGKTGSLSTRTDNETGTLTLGSGHGITTGQIIDLYWDGGARYGITVGTVAGTSVPIGNDNSGSGSNLPTASTAIVAAPRVYVEAPIENADLRVLVTQLLFANPQIAAAGVMRFFDGADQLIITVPLESGVPRIYDLLAGDANPIDGETSAYVYVSHGSATAPANFKMLWLENATL